MIGLWEPYAKCVCVYVCKTSPVSLKKASLKALYEGTRKTLVFIDRLTFHMKAKHGK